MNIPEKLIKHSTDEEVLKATYQAIIVAYDNLDENHGDAFSAGVALANLAEAKALLGKYISKKFPGGPDILI